MSLTPPDVVVIGAGFAGLSAAVRLAEAGLRVTVVEEAPRLGGRASAFSDPVSGERVDNGQHVLFGCYRETYRFLKCLGTDGLAPLDRRLNLTMVGSDGQGRVLSCPRLPPPLHLVAGILKWDAMPMRDRLAALKLAPAIMRARRARAPLQRGATGTVAEWLAAHGQSAALCRWLWHPLAIAALNQSPDVACAEAFVRVLGDLFGSHPDDSAIGLPSVPLDELYAIPAARFIEAHGGTVMLKTSASIVLDASGQIAHVAAGSARLPTRAVISAVPWHGFSRLWPAGCPAAIADTVSAADRMRASPIVTVNLWFDGPVMTQRLVGLVDRPMHWVFDKRAIVGASASHVTVVASDAPRLADLENAEIERIAIADLEHALPEARGRRLLRSVVVREHRATFSLAVDAPDRPATMTAVRGLFLAGDWVNTGLPATIESAVVSGHRAAAYVLRRREASALVR